MRFLGLIILLVGSVAAFGGQFFDIRPAGFEIGRYAIFSSADGSSPATVYISDDDGPIAVSVEVVIPADAYDAYRESRMILDIEDRRGLFHSTPILFSSKSALHLDNGNLLAEVVTIDDILPGDYTFTLKPGDFDNLPVLSADLILQGNMGGFPYDLRPIGFTMIVIGGVMLLLGGRRRRRRSQPAASASKTSSIGYRQAEPEPEKSKPAMKWGRDGDQE